MSSKGPLGWLDRVKKSLFAGEQLANSGSEEEPAARPGGKEGDEVWVPLSLDDLLRHHPTARLHMISLADYHASIGAAWKKRSKVVLLLAETTLRAHLKPGETLFQTAGGDAFILFFPKLSLAEAVKRAMEAADHLGRKLVGEKFSDGHGATPAVRLTSFSALDVANEEGELDAEALGKQADKAERIDTFIPHPSRHRPAMPAPLATDDSGKSDWRKVAHEARPQPLDLAPIPSPRDAKKKPAPQWLPIEKKKE
jgi:hypothetical protein